MENNESLISEPDEEKIIWTEENDEPETGSEEETELLPADDGEEVRNLEICPNCLEPNTENLAVCRYCGMPLNQGADPDAYVRAETEAELAANRAAAVPQEKKPAKKQESGFRRYMPWLGLYLIYYAITGCFDISRQIKQAAEDGQAVNAPLAYLSQAIWFAAGLLMAWPLIKKGYRKLRHLPEEDEVPEEPAADNTSAEEGSDLSPDQISQNEESESWEEEYDPEDGKEADEEYEDTAEDEE